MLELGEPQPQPSIVMPTSELMKELLHQTPTRPCKRDPKGEDVEGRHRIDILHFHYGGSPLICLLPTPEAAISDIYCHKLG